ncbi:glutamic acid-rich protein-like [Cotesia glomerata]|uniref:glutamic acid-rich protein-like n=1 Tax=Cotesia glomerata TaxID=32391 RepID=UPI001D0176BC|nr:glutamic acid-rich protein-like [Cotesia glomerata]
MKKNKEVSDEDEYSADDPDEVGEEASEEELEGAEHSTKKRPQRAAANKKRQHSEEEDEEDEDDEDNEGEEDEDEDSDSDAPAKSKKKRRSKKDEDEDEDSDNSFNESSGVPPKDYTSGAFVVAKADVGGDSDPTLWRIDGKALLQKFLPFKEEGKTLYKSTSTYSGWSADHKEKYFAAQVTFKVQKKNETIVELHLNQQQQQEVVK